MGENGDVSEFSYLKTRGFAAGFEMDPAGFAPASSGANTDMLHAYNTGPGPN